MNILAPVFSAILSGVEDSTTDYPFAIVNFSLQKKDAVPSYYSMTAPFTLALLEAFETRPNGTIRMLADGVEFEYFNVSYQSFARGPNSSSILISGTRQETNAAPVSYTIENEVVLNERTDSLGRTVIEVVPFALDIQPGDAAVWNAVTFDVITVSHQVGNRSKVEITLEEPAP